VSGEARVFIKNQAESRKKSETAKDGGGCVSAAPNGPINTPDPKAQETVAKISKRKILEKK
jgi:hypothetical protein